LEYSKLNQLNLLGNLLMRLGFTTMKPRMIALCLLTCCNAGSAISQTPQSSSDASPQPRNPHVEAVVDHLVGVMDTSAQAGQNSDRVGVQMTTCRVAVATTTAEPSSVYLYQEQALMRSLESPYRQRLLQITVNDTGGLESRTFKLVDESLWVGRCDELSGQSLDHHVISQPVNLPEAIVPEAVCVVNLRPSALGYVGSTPLEGCPIELQGATRLTNIIVLHDAGMDTWDRGFDGDGNQVWGAEAAPYEFRWQER
jgi:hypothetical protein